ncbi:Magnesium transporter MgtE [Poriferisphaera corsica]|uniref:Magnesium transporter MgtE n=1 Tax=Poriferisphaera corsica TaxID=2528020 RepID=A0A517YTX6_9BACT|nr:magnesium transporter [Poriferisphaera corsica]QDU33667.1 Magnesium transporter MgtE [Poriferisphaera corsica]
MPEQSKPSITDPKLEPIEQLEAILSTSDNHKLESFVYEIPSGEMARTISLLDEEDQKSLLTRLPADAAAWIVEELSHQQAADIIEELHPDDAADIIDELPSDEQADIIGELDDDDAEAIIEKMEPEEAEDVRLLSKYDSDTAGGLMVTEFLTFLGDTTVGDMADNIRQNAEEYHEYDVQYLYVVNPQEELLGVVRMRDMVMCRPEVKVKDIMMSSPKFVHVNDHLDFLEDFFDAIFFNAVPVLDEQNKMVGVLKRADMEEALGDRSERQLLRLGGIIAGDEMRTMPTFPRAARRLAFLGPNIFLNLIAAGVLIYYQNTISQIVALVVFMPMISDMCGCSGNQAVAVSMRELALGLVRPTDIWRTVIKEAAVGIINGLILGILIGLLAWGVGSFDLGPLQGQPNIAPMLGLVVALAFFFNCIIAVIIGGTVPLVLKGLKMDPAMASGPILTTITDVCGFALIFGLATWLIIP